MLSEDIEGETEFIPKVVSSISLEFRGEIRTGTSSNRVFSS